MEEKAATWDENPQEFKVSNDWVECVTDNGDIYFTNVVNGETSWTKPEFEQNQAIWTGDDNTRELSMHEENTEETELLVKSAIIEAGEVAQWMELYDSDQQAVYYFSPKSGEVRLESPQEEIVLVRQCNSDAVLSSIVSLQSAARSQQTRARVAAIRQQKLKERQLEDDSTSSHHQYELNGESGAEASQLDSDSQWVEVYDPATQQQYYYSPRTSETSWDRPEAFKIAAWLLRFQFSLFLGVDLRENEFMTFELNFHYATSM
ncbi:Hypothetical protein PHPALM_17465 [Phytophthora palmivora]|uniref:WW domain-containing protein n=1 Tax=Phytophthora palmivora TaxID=4796 RepID=A0A2P4XM93_9STRA|nr:Hypothetical protein PHPALM_17465 [Phytophthora palmivora]